MSKSNNNTQNMLTILESFQNRLKKLESTVEPVYNETEMLRRRQESILENSIVTYNSVLYLIIFILINLIIIHSK